MTPYGSRPHSFPLQLATVCGVFFCSLVFGAGLGQSADVSPFLELTLNQPGGVSLPEDFESFNKAESIVQGLYLGQKHEEPRKFEETFDLNMAAKTITGRTNGVHLITLAYTNKSGAPASVPLLVNVTNPGSFTSPPGGTPAPPAAPVPASVSTPIPLGGNSTPRDALLNKFEKDLFRKLVVSRAKTWPEISSDREARSYVHLRDQRPVATCRAIAKTLRATDQAIGAFKGNDADVIKAGMADLQSRMEQLYLPTNEFDDYSPIQRDWQPFLKDLSQHIQSLLTAAKVTESPELFRRILQELALGFEDLATEINGGGFNGSTGRNSGFTNGGSGGVSGHDPANCPFCRRKGRGCGCHSLLR